MSLIQHVYKHNNEKWIYQLHQCMYNIHMIHNNYIISTPILDNICKLYPHIVYNHIIEFHNTQHLLQTKYKKSVYCYNCNKLLNTLSHISEIIVPINTKIPYNNKYKIITDNVFCSCRYMKAKHSCNILKNKNNITSTIHKNLLQIKSDNVENSKLKYMYKRGNTNLSMVWIEVIKPSKYMVWICRDIIKKKWRSYPLKTYEIKDINSKIYQYKLSSFMLCFGYGSQVQYITIVYKGEKCYCHNNSNFVEISNERAEDYRTCDNVYMCFYMNV